MKEWKIVIYKGTSSTPYLIYNDTYIPRIGEHINFGDKESYLVKDVIFHKVNNNRERDYFTILINYPY